MGVIIRENPETLAAAAAEMFADCARACISERGRCTVAVSGGSTPRRMHGIMAGDPYRSEIPWDAIHIFWVDERCVPEDDEASNYGAARRDLFDHIPVPEDNLHPMPINVPPQEGKKRYQKELIEFFHLVPGALPLFDMIFLGIGRDGHTASLFPRQKALGETEQLILPVRGGTPDVSRLTMTLPVLNNARRIIILASGREKAPVVEGFFSQRSRHERFPVQMIRPHHGELVWILDRDAASSLPDTLSPSPVTGRNRLSSG